MTEQNKMKIVLDVDDDIEEEQEGSEIDPSYLPDPSLIAIF